MAEKTAIAWTRSTFNPWIGCTKIGPGCDNCYAEQSDKMRFSKTLGGGTKERPIIHWGAGAPRYRTSPELWKEPLKWNAQAVNHEYRAKHGDFAGRPGYWPVFCASLADVFDNEVPAEWRADLMKLIVDTPHLSWLLVTKRIGNVPRMIEEAGDGEGWQSMWGQGAWPDNVRLLITVCNQEEADRDIPKLLALPCKNGVSYEPALGPVDWAKWLRRSAPIHDHGAYAIPENPRLQWIIVGGESTQGSGKGRPFDVAWARSAVAQCKAAGVPAFVKQLGSNIIGSMTGPVWSPRHEDTGKGYFRIFLKERAGVDPSEWPEDLRVREWPA